MRRLVSLKHVGGGPVVTKQDSFGPHHMKPCDFVVWEVSTPLHLELEFLTIHLAWTVYIQVKKQTFNSPYLSSCNPLKPGAPLSQCGLCYHEHYKCSCMALNFFLFSP